MQAAQVEHLVVLTARSHICTLRDLALLAASWLRRIVCGLRGHNLLINFAPAHVWLRCQNCGFETPGWMIDARTALQGRMVQKPEHRAHEPDERRLSVARMPSGAVSADFVARTLPEDPSVNLTSTEAMADIDLTPDILSNLKWIFVHDGQFLTCESGVSGPRSYDVYVIPHWDVGSSVIEPYDQPAAALHRHAQFVSRLRDAGWVRISENRTRHLAAA